MSANGTKQTSLVALHMSAIGGKADIALGSPATWLLTQGGTSALFTLGYSLQAYINTVTLLARSVTVDMQYPSKAWVTCYLAPSPQQQEV